MSERPAWLTDERLAELRAIGERMDAASQAECPCCGETAHACMCSYESVAIAPFSAQNQPLAAT